MNRTATIAVLAALASGPAFAQTTTDEDTDVIVIDPAESTEVETVEPDVEVIDPEVETVEPEVEVIEPEVETVEPDVEVIESDVEVVDPEVVEVEPEVMDGEPLMENTGNLIRTRDITGGPIYSTGEEYYDEARWTATDPFDTARTGAYEPYGYDSNYDNIGNIEDVILDSSGQMIGIVAEIGGFLGIGEHNVLLPVGDVRLVPVDDQSYSYVTRYTEEQLEQLPDVDEGPFE